MQLKERIIAVVRAVDEDVNLLQRVMQEFVRRLQECVYRHGGHLNDVIFKK